jgi:hypothetical protein
MSAARRARRESHSRAYESSKKSGPSVDSADGSARLTSKVSSKSIVLGAVRSRLALRHEQEVLACGSAATRRAANTLEPNGTTALNYIPPQTPARTAAVSTSAPRTTTTQNEPQVAKDDRTPAKHARPRVDAPSQMPHIVDDKKSDIDAPAHDSAVGVSGVSRFYSSSSEALSVGSLRL